VLLHDFNQTIQTTKGGKEMRMTMKKLTQGATRLAAALSLVDFSFGGKGVA